MNFTKLLQARLSFRKIGMGTALALITLLLVIILGYQSIGENQRSTVWVTHTLAVISKIQTVETELNDRGRSQAQDLATALLQKQEEPCRQ